MTPRQQLVEKLAEEYEEELDRKIGSDYRWFWGPKIEEAFLTGFAAADEGVAELISAVDKIMRDPKYSSHSAIALWEQALKRWEAHE
jgi:hypothetical protein